MTSTNSWTGKGLNGTPSNIENMQIIPSAGLAWIFYQYLCNRSTFGFEFELLRIKPCSFILYQWRAENGWLMMSYTSATHVSLVHDITKTARHKIVSSRHCTPVPYMPVLFATSQRLLDTKMVGSWHCTPVPHMPVLLVISHRLPDTKWLCSLHHTPVPHVSFVRDITKTARHKMVGSWHCAPVPHVSLVRDITQTARYKMAMLTTVFSHLSKVNFLADH